MKDLQILTLQQVAKLLQISVPTIYRWEQEGNLPFKKIKIGKRSGFREVDVRKFINDQIEEPEMEGAAQ